LPVGVGDSVHHDADCLADLAELVCPRIWQDRLEQSVNHRRFRQEALGLVV
jgi:hypothetical protein